MASKIHPTAVIGDDVTLGEDVEIGPYCVVEDHVSIGAGSRLIAQCHVASYTTMGEENVLYPFAAIGNDPQDYAYDPSLGPSYTKIGNRNRFREGVTVHRGTHAETETVIGDGCFLMANAHVGHNCVLGNNVIMVPSCALGGYCQLGDRCIISGLCGVHQFCRVGRLALLSGGSSISMDLPPFMIGDGRNGGVRGFNAVGLRRNGFSREAIHAIKEIYDIFFRQGLSMPNAIARAEAELPQLPEVKEFIEFVKSTKRGILPGDHHGRRA